ncbi:MAG: Lrp/AsnC family transcriptional regulator [Thermoanaerobaculia bacterium]
MIDGTDRQILSILQKDARTSNAEIGRRVGMTPSAILERIRKLESRGVVTAFEARVAPRQVGLGLTAFVFVRTDESPGRHDSARELAELDEVLEVHHIAGEDCYLAKVVARDAGDLGRFLRERVGSIPAVTSTRTTVVLETIRESSRLPLGEEGSDDAE